MVDDADGTEFRFLEDDSKAYPREHTAVPARFGPRLKTVPHRDRFVTTPTGSSLSFSTGLVVKRHRAGTSLTELQQRLDAIVHAPFLQPLGPAECIDGTVVTRWPRVEVARPQNPPWREAGRLLAELHATEPTVQHRQLPRPTWSERVTRAAARTPDPELAALGNLLARQAVDHRGEGNCLSHGDWHLGQLGYADSHWLLLDPDDVAFGDPWWDLARPAGFWAAGLLSDESWHEFLEGYDSPTPPWPAVDIPARCAVFVAAVRASLHREPTAEALLEACRRLAQSVS